MICLLKPKTGSSENSLTDDEFNEVLEYKLDFLLFPTVGTLAFYKKNFDPTKIKEVEDDLLDLWRQVILERT